MYYRVIARLRPENAAALHAKLSDGSIASQPPDGAEIAEALDRAVLTDDGRVRWSMVCYCSTPLAHEREVVLDEHFAELDVEPIDGYESLEGPSFMKHLAGKVGVDGAAESP